MEEADSGIEDDVLSQTDSEVEDDVAENESPVFSDKESALQHLQENYRNVNSPICFQSITFLKKFYKILTKNDIENVLSTFESFSLMKPLRYRKKYNPFISFHIRDVFQLGSVY